MQSLKNDTKRLGLYFLLLLQPSDFNWEFLHRKDNWRFCDSLTTRDKFPKQESDELGNQPLDKRERAEHWTQPWWWSRQKLCPTKTGTLRTSTANANSPILGPSQVSWLARISKISVQKIFAGLSAPHQILSIQ